MLVSNPNSTSMAIHPLLSQALRSTRHYPLKYRTLVGNLQNTFLLVVPMYCQQILLLSSQDHKFSPECTKMFTSSSHWYLIQLYKNSPFTLHAFTDAVLTCDTTTSPLLATSCIWVTIPSHGVQRNNELLLDPPPEPSSML